MSTTFTPQLAGLYAQHHQTLCKRHSEILETENYDWLVIYSGLPHLLFLDDRSAPFAANPQFRSWLPLPDHRGGAVLVNRKGQTQLVYFKPPDYWELPPPAPDAAWADCFDLKIIEKPSDIEQHLSALTGRIAVVADDTSPATVLEAGELNPARLIARLHYARVTKTDYEVECMRQANRIAVRGHIAAAEAFRSGASEFDIHLEYCRAAGQTPAQLPYDNIVACNEHGAILHYGNYDRLPVAQSRSFLIDAGASFNGYAADITRTYCADDSEFATLINSIDRIQTDICALTRDGIDYVDLHLEANQMLGQVLADHELIHCSAEAAVNDGITNTFFPHGLGHYIGTQVHDVAGHQSNAEGQLRPPPPQHPFLRLTRRLHPGAVCTIEPGLYFIDLLLDKLKHGDSADQLNWQKIDTLKPYGGIRIEDDVHVTTSGNENLSRDAFAQAL